MARKMTLILMIRSPISTVEVAVRNTQAVETSTEVINTEETNTEVSDVKSTEEMNTEETNMVETSMEEINTEETNMVEAIDMRSMVDKIMAEAEAVMIVESAERDLDPGIVTSMAMVGRKRLFASSSPYGLI